MATLLIPLNSTMIVVALPQLIERLGTDLAGAAWLVTIYLIAMAALQPVAGKIGDRLGRRRLLLASLVYFGLASLAAAFASDVGWLIAFRVQQAIAGAFIMPNASALLRGGPDERRGSAFALLAAATGTGAALGPVLGGLLVTLFDWRAIFLVNAPITAAALALAWRAIPGDPQRVGAARFDLAGAVGLSLLLAGGAWTLTRGARDVPGAMPLLVLVLVVGGVALVAYESRREDAVLQPRMFRDRTFAAANVAIAFGNFAMYSAMLIVPLLLARGGNGSGVGSGLALSGLFAGMVIFSPIGGRAADRVGRRWPCVLGYSLLATGLAGLALAGTPTGPVIAGALAVAGLGLGVSAGGLRAAAVESVDPGLAGVASGIFSTSRYFGGIVASIAVGALLGSGTGEFGVAFATCAGGAVAAALASVGLSDWPTVAQSPQRAVS